MHRVIGSGSYGAVVEPALPNVDEHGKPLIFGPDKVTKVMFNETNYKKTVADAALILEQIPSLATNVTPYRRTYTEQDIASIPKMQKFIDSQQNRNGVFMVRMPNLGMDLYELYYNKTEMVALRSTVPPAQIIRQILKLMRVVKAIGQAGYIHADIRESNVLCSNTGELSIIDFDWMMTPKEIQKSYPIYFYSHPPESMFLLDKVMPIDNYLASPDRNAFRDRVYYNAVKYMEQNKRDEFWIKIQLHGTTRNDFARKIAQNMVGLYDTATHTNPAAALKQFREIYYQTADSFGLAVALKDFAVGYFHKQEDTDTRRFLRDILFTEMTHTGSKRRMKIDRAIIMLQDYVRVAFPDIQLGEEVSFTGEVGRLGALVDLMSEKRKRSEERLTLRQQVEGLALMTKYLENLSTPSSSPSLPPLPPSPLSRTGLSSNRRTGHSSNRRTGSRKTHSRSSSSRRKTLKKT
jgi:hypothetical protein